MADVLTPADVAAIRERAARLDYTFDVAPLCDSHDRLAAQVERLRAANGVLAVALVPFAERAESIPLEADDNQYWADDSIQVGRFRAARKALRTALADAAGGG